MESTFALTGGLVLRVREGDLCAYEGDCVVNAANNHLWMGAGVAGALKRAGGAEIEREAVAQGPLPVGGAVLTGAGGFPLEACARIMLGEVERFASAPGSVGEVAFVLFGAAAYRVFEEEARRRFSHPTA